MTTKYVFLSLACFVTIGLNAQLEQKPKSKLILEKGVELHDKEQYQEAIEEFNKINRNDVYYSDAIYEKTVSFFYDKKYDSVLAICELARNQDIYDRAEFYITEANSLDEKGKSDEAMKLYNEALTKYPMNHMLYFNRGVCHEKAKRRQEALYDYQQALLINPFHASSHYRLGNLAFEEGLLTQGLLSVNAYLLIRPEAKISLDVIVYGEKMVTQKHEGQESKLIFSPEGDNFSEVEAILRNQLALNKKYKLESKADFPLVRQTQALFTFMAKHEGQSGFYEKLYVPIFGKIYNDHLFEIYTYYAIQSSTNSSVVKLVSKNQSKIKEFNNWVLENAPVLMAQRERMVDGKKEMVRQIYYNNHLYGYGKFENGLKEGRWEFFHSAGNQASVIYYKNDLRTGTAKYYSEKGILVSEKNFKQDKLDGKILFNYSNGNIKEESVYIADSTEGPYKYYHRFGGVKYTGSYINNKLNGPVTEYSSNGNVKTEMNYLKGKMNGEVKAYNLDGKPDYTTPMKNDEKDGKRQTYYYNGQVKTVENYVADKLNGEYKGYYPNGKLEKEGVLKNGVAVGEYKTYYENGNLSMKRVFDKEGSLTGTAYSYDEDGILYYEAQIVKDKMVSFKYYDKKGNVTRNVKINDNTTVEYLRPDGTLANVNHYKAKELDGERKEYYRNGKLSGEMNYSKGELNGMRKFYYKNGQLSSSVNMAQGNRDGDYIAYYITGKLKTKGHYEADQPDGEWTEYFQDGAVRRRYFYQNGELQGRYEIYSVGGKLFEVEHFDEGDKIWYAKYDSTGKEVFRIIFETPGKRDVKYQGINGVETYVLPLVNGSGQGVGECTLTDGSKIYSGPYVNGYRHGIWKTYGPGGKIASERTQVAGDLEGMYKRYDELGNLTSESNYRNDALHGVYKKYYFNGKLYYESDYVEGDEHGLTKYYGPNGELVLIIGMNHDDLIYYIRNNPKGEMKDTVYVKNETASIEGNYKSGKPAILMSYKNGLLQGIYKVFYPGGAPIIEANFENGFLHGERKYYFESGIVSKIERFNNGDDEGAFELFWENGKKRAVINHRKEALDGLTQWYDKEGKLIETRVYYDDDVISLTKN